LNTTVFWPIDEDPVDCNVAPEQRVNTMQHATKINMRKKQNAYRTKKGEKTPAARR
jgi:hypothetical protein